MQHKRDNPAAPGRTVARRWFFAIGINLLCLFLLCMMFPTSEKTEDLLVKLVLSGAISGHIDAHLPFVNYLLGAVLSLLQRFAPRIAWFEVSQLLLVFASLTAFTFAVFRPKNAVTNALVVLPILLFFGFEAYNKISFVKTAGLSVSAGFFLLVYGSRGRRNRSLFSIGAVLVLLGGLFCANMVYAVFPFFFGLSIIEYIASRNRFPRSGKTKLRTAILMVLVVVFSIGLQWAGSLAYNGNKEWADYHKSVGIVSALQGREDDYQEKEEEYRALDVSSNDLLMIENGDFTDSNSLPISQLERVLAIRNDSAGLKTIAAFFREALPKALDNRVIGVVFLLVFMAAVNLKSWKKLLLVYLAVMLFLEYLVIFLRGHLGQVHVDFSMACAVAMCLCYSLVGEEMTRPREVLCGALVVIVFLNAVSTNMSYMQADSYSGSKPPIESKQARSVLDRLSGDRGHLFVLSNEEYDRLMQAYGVLDVPAPGELGNIVVLSTYMNPAYHSMLKDRGIDNIYDHFMDEDVLYASSASPGNVKTILTYLREHSHKDVVYDTWKNINGVTVYKFSIYTGPA